jgi:cell pole-organizing protein PopZ
MSDNKLPAEPSMDEILASIRRILTEDDHAVTRPSPPRLRGNADVLDLTEAINDDGSVRHIAPVSLVVPEVPRKLPDGRIEPVPPRPRDAAAESGVEPRLVSDTASEAVAASFARLASASQHEGNGSALDDLVRETLRPMLQAWLDAHLPELVERLVRAEIARVVGAIRPSAP